MERRDEGTARLRPDGAAPAGPSGPARWVARVAVGFGALVVAALVVAGVGYVVLMDRWADAYDSSSATAPSPVGTTSSSATASELDGEGLDPSNEAYRERRGTPAGDAEAALWIPAVEAALTPLVTGEPLRRDAVVSALTGAGFETFGVTPETTASGDPATTFGVGVGVPGGCVYGGVAPEGVSLEAGGPIADGGCLEMPSH